MKKTETVSFTIPLKANLSNKDIEQGAKNLDINKSQYIVQMLEMTANLDHDVLNNVLSYAKGLDVQPHIVLQNILIKYFVENLERKGKPLPEFTRVMNEEGQSVTLTGEDLRSFLKDQARQDRNNLRRIAKLQELDMYTPDELEEEDKDEYVTQEEVAQWEVEAKAKWKAEQKK